MAYLAAVSFAVFLVLATGDSLPLWLICLVTFAFGAVAAFVFPRRRVR